MKRKVKSVSLLPNEREFGIWILLPGDFVSMEPAISKQRVKATPESPLSDHQADHDPFDCLSSVSLPRFHSLTKPSGWSGLGTLSLPGWSATHALSSTSPRRSYPRLSTCALAAGENAAGSPSSIQLRSMSVSTCASTAIRCECGKTSTAWFFGFTLHLVINERGTVLHVCIPPGNGDDRTPVARLAQHRFGNLFGDKGSISQKLADPLCEMFNAQLMTRLLA